MAETHDARLAKNAQIKYCHDNKAPYFAPEDGRCYKCHANIYEKSHLHDGSVSWGITIESAGAKLITGCPHCHRSYCD